MKTAGWLLIGLFLVIGFVSVASVGLSPEVLGLAAVFLVPGVALAVLGSRQARQTHSVRGDAVGAQSEGPVANSGADQPNAPDAGTLPMAGPEQAPVKDQEAWRRLDRSRTAYYILFFAIIAGNIGLMIVRDRPGYSGLWAICGC